MRGIDELRLNVRAAIANLAVAQKRLDEIDKLFEAFQTIVVKQFPPSSEMVENTLPKSLTWEHWTCPKCGWVNGTESLECLYCWSSSAAHFRRNEITLMML